MRLFFGLPLPQSIAGSVHACAIQAKESVPGRYTLPENYHITLAFLGETNPERLPDAAAVLARCAAEFPVPQLRLDGLSHFGRAQNGILILKIADITPLAPLHDALIAQLRAASLPADPGPFSPHITLARHAVIPEHLPVCPAASFSCPHAHVYLSARDEQNILRYTPLYSAAFGASSP